MNLCRKHKNHEIVKENLCVAELTGLFLGTPSTPRLPAYSASSPSPNTSHPPYHSAVHIGQTRAGKSWGEESGG